MVPRPSVAGRRPGPDVVGERPGPERGPGDRSQGRQLVVGVVAVPGPVRAVPRREGGLDGPVGVHLARTTRPSRGVPRGRQRLAPSEDVRF